MDLEIEEHTIFDNVLADGFQVCSAHLVNFVHGQSYYSATVCASETTLVGASDYVIAARQTSHLLVK